ncbi:MAG: antitoxin VapB family protein [Candidatus Odinarchaeum yellowstonii]|uniref:Antitoxin VapB family protein n=1 Tax=Odinarchaeota yellowstonii (strain LCB_4) TaxID=1841599 RepID=A0AAF0D1V3_ODILC|nr:MAG: antitoxin VapB family protein [Candidatus Odinarchaeum yellowstonii]
MVVKNISIKDKVYRMLKEEKQGEESFSDVIEKLITKRKIDLKDFYGVLKDSTVLDELMEKIREYRSEARLRI